MAVREYLKACQDLFRSGVVREDTIQKHLQHQIVLDKLLPNSPSFFFVVEPAKNAYHFLGKQQETVSGFSNQEVLERGMEFLYTRLPSELQTVLSPQRRLLIILYNGQLRCIFIERK